MNKPFLTILTVLIFLLFCPQFGQRFLFQNFTPYDYHRLLELGLLFFTGIGLICIPRQATAWLNCFNHLKTSTKLIIPLFFLLGIMSALFSANISMGLLWVGHTILLFVFGITVASIVKNAPQKSNQFILGGLMLVACLYLFWEWLNTLTILFKSIAHIPFDTDKAIQALRFPGYSNPRFLGQVLAFTFPLIVVHSIYFWEKRKIGMCLLLMCLAAGWWQMLWMNQSRALYLVVIVLGVGAIILFRKQSLKWLTFQGIALIAGFILYIILFHVAYHIPERGAHSFTQDSRLALWLMTLKLIWHHLVLGVGPMNFVPYGLPFKVSHPHNALLYIAVEWGVPAVIIFISLTCIGCFKWLTFAKHHISPLNIALTGSLVAGIIDAQFSGVLLMPTSQVFMAIILGWIFGTLTQERHPDDAAGIRQDPSDKSSNKMGTDAKLRLYQHDGKMRAILIIIILFAAALTAQSLSPKIFNLPTIESQLCTQQFKHSDKCLLIPSYWGDGKRT